MPLHQASARAWQQPVCEVLPRGELIIFLAEVSPALCHLAWPQAQGWCTGCAAWVRSWTGPHLWLAVQDPEAATKPGSPGELQLLELPSLAGVLRPERCMTHHAGGMYLAAAGLQAGSRCVVLPRSAPAEQQPPTGMFGRAAPCQLARQAETSCEVAGFTCLSYDEDSCSILACTTSGHVQIWSR